jgi:hypothetical protein
LLPELPVIRAATRSCSPNSRRAVPGAEVDTAGRTAREIATRGRARSGDQPIRARERPCSRRSLGQHRRHRR